MPFSTANLLSFSATATVVQYAGASAWAGPVETVYMDWNDGEYIEPVFGEKLSDEVPLSGQRVTLTLKTLERG